MHHIAYRSYQPVLNGKMRVIDVNDGSIVSHQALFVYISCRSRANTASRFTSSLSFQPNAAALPPSRRSRRGKASGNDGITGRTWYSPLQYAASVLAIDASLVVSCHYSPTLGRNQGLKLTHTHTLLFVAAHHPGKDRSTLTSFTFLDEWSLRLFFPNPKYPSHALCLHRTTPDHPPHHYQPATDSLFAEGTSAHQQSRLQHKLAMLARNSLTSTLQSFSSSIRILNTQTRKMVSSSMMKSTRSC